MKGRKDQAGSASAAAAKVALAASAQSVWRRSHNARAIAEEGDLQRSAADVRKATMPCRATCRGRSAMMASEGELTVEGGGGGAEVEVEEAAAAVLCMETSIVACGSSFIATAVLALVD